MCIYGTRDQHVSKVLSPVDLRTSKPEGDWIKAFLYKVPSNSEYKCQTFICLKAILKRLFSRRACFQDRGFFVSKLFNKNSCPKQLQTLTNAVQISYSNSYGLIVRLAWIGRIYSRGGLLLIRRMLLSEIPGNLSYVERTFSWADFPNCTMSCVSLNYFTPTLKDNSRFSPPHMSIWSSYDPRS